MKNIDNLKVLADGYFQFNPDAFIPLTLYNIDVEIVDQIQSLFLEKSGPDIIDNLRRLFASESLRIKEIDDEPSPISELEIRQSLSFSSPLDRAELFFWIYASDYYRRKNIIRYEEAFMYGAITGIEYTKLDCKLPECQERHGKIFSINEAKKLKFMPGCRCDLLPYNSRWDIKEG